MGRPAGWWFIRPPPRSPAEGSAKRDGPPGNVKGSRDQGDCGLRIGNCAARLGAGHGPTCGLVVHPCPTSIAGRRVGETRWATSPGAGSSGGDGWTPPRICRSVVPPGLGCGKGTRPSNELLGYFRVVPTARNPVGWSAAARGYRARTSSLPRFPLAARGCTKRVKALLLQM